MSAEDSNDYRRSWIMFYKPYNIILNNQQQKSTRKAD